MELVMRRIALLALVVAMTAVTGMLARPAEAGHRLYRDADRVVVHYGYYPRYRHVYVTEDPYAYRYEPRGYYPYYNSGYWKSAREMRLRKRRHYNHPPYYAAWGYPDPYYHHRAWHAYNHGRIRHGHW
jgi:hypothetical protein